MRTSHLLLATLVATQLTACTCTSGRSPTQVASNIIQRQSVVPTTKEHYPAKNPQMVSFYTEDRSPQTAYRVIGVATISKHNLLGTPREETTMRSMMQRLAASIGGDGIINVTSSNDAMQAHVIAFQKILI